MPTVEIVATINNTDSMGALPHIQCIAVPNTHNLAKTITDKQKKYQELANEMCATWKKKAAQVIPIIISSTTNVVIQ